MTAPRHEAAGHPGNERSSEVAAEKPLILVICVDYHNDELTVSFTNHVLSLPSVADVRVVVVDNRPQNERTPQAALEVSEATVYVPGKNLGYLGGADWGRTSFMAETGCTPEWIIVSNPDIELPDDRFFDHLLELGHDSAGPPPEVVAPDIVLSEASGRGKPIRQNPYMPRRPSPLAMRAFLALARFPVAYALYDYLSVWRLLSGVSQHHRVPPGVRIYAPFGAFLVFHRSFFDRGGELSKGPFLFGEEIFIAETARALGMSVRYDPSLVVVHHQQLLRRPFASRRRQAQTTHDSLRFLVDRYFG